MKNDVCLSPGVALSENCFMPPAGDFLPIALLHRERVSDGLLFPAAGKVGKRAAKNQWFLDFLYSQEPCLLWDVVGIDTATDPLPLPLR